MKINISLLVDLMHIAKFFNLRLLYMNLLSCILITS